MNGLIFDCDGVLADTERDGHRIAFNRLFDEVGLEFHWDEMAYGHVLAVAGGKERLRKLLTPAFVEAHGLPVDSREQSEIVQAWHSRKTAIYLELIASGDLVPRRGIRRLAIEALEAGWSLGVASTSAVPSVTAVLRLAVGPDLASDILICGGDMVPAKKPAPDIYLLAASKLGVAPAKAVAVEDSAIGVAAAVSAGLPTIATPSTYTRNENLSAATIVATDLGEPGSGRLSVQQNRTDIPIRDAIDVSHLTALVS